MADKTLNQSTLENFTIQLEFLALKAENEIMNLEKENNCFKYIKDLEEVLEKSFLAFAEGYMNLSREKKEEFESMISIFVSRDFLDKLLSEIKNLYYLKQEKLFNKKEVSSQQEISFEVINKLLLHIKAFYNQNKYKKNDKDISSLNTYVENIISLANTMYLGEVVEDIDFFAKVLEEVILSDLEKKEIIKYFLVNNIKNYSKNAENVSIEAYNGEVKSNEVREDVELLLEEMLSDSSINSGNSWKKKL